MIVIAECDSRFLPIRKRIGICRFDMRSNDTAVVSINLARSFRGRGLAKELLEASLFRLRDSFPEVKSVDAAIRPENTESRRLFVSVGFQLREEGGHLDRWEKRLLELSSEGPS